MISLVKNEIQGVTTEVVIDETPIILIGDVNIESIRIRDIDTVPLVKAVAESETVEEFCDKILETYIGNAVEIVIAIKSLALQALNVNCRALRDCPENRNTLHWIQLHTKTIEQFRDSPKVVAVEEMRLYNLYGRLIYE